MTALVSGLLALLGIAQIVREIFSPALQDKYNLHRVLPDWSLSTWAALFLGAIVVVTAEGAFAAVRDASRQRDAKDEDLRQARRMLEPRFTFEFTHPSCEMENQESPDPSVTHRIALRNRGGSPIRRAKVQLIDLLPMPQNLAGRLPLPMHPMHATIAGAEFDLAPGETRLVDVFDFDYDKIALCHLMPNVVRTIPYGLYTLTFEAVAYDTQRLVTSVDLRLGERSEIWLQPAEAGA